MRVLWQLVRRNMRLYLRDRASVFFSFLSVIIIIIMYFLFLGDLQVSDLKRSLGDVDGIEWLVNSWIMAGVLTVSTITVPLGILGILIKDREENRLNDFYTSPINRNILALGYLVSAWIISYIMVFFNFIIGQVYVVLQGGQWLNIGDASLILLIMALSIMAFSSLFFFIAIFMRSQNAFGLLSTLVGTFVGFLGGIYIPIGVLGESVQTVMNFLPTAHAVTLIRNIYMRGAVDNLFGENPTGDALGALESYESIYGLTVEVMGYNMSLFAMVVSLMLFGIIFYIASSLVLRRSKL